MNRNRIKKMIEEATALREAEKRDNNPNFAPWVEKANRHFEQAVNRLNTMGRQARWDAAMSEQLQAVLDDHWNWTLASLGLCGKPEPRAFIHWFTIFPDWLALIPGDLQLAALLELGKERARRCNWLDEWLRFLSWGTMKIPEGLTVESMGIIVRTVVENVDALGPFSTYCRKCALLFPMRDGHVSGILPACPHCGNSQHAYSHAFG